MSETTQRIEDAMEKYAPSGYDPASDDLTIPFAMQLVHKDELIATMEKYIALLVKSEGSMLGLAHSHGFRFPQQWIDEGAQLRERIAELKAAVTS